MRTNRWGFALILILVGVTLVILSGQRRTAAELRGEIARQRAEVSARPRLEAEARQLATRQVSAEALERLRTERGVIASLRAEIEAMKRRAETIVHAATERGAVAIAPQAIAPSIRDVAVAANLWRNAGDASPDAAFETALWAGVGGDIEKLASLLAFDAAAQTKAEAIFANLPVTMQQELGTPQKLIALLVAKDVPLGSARVWAQYGSPTDMKISAQLVDPSGKSKMVQLPLHAEGDKWRFVVSEKIVERYAARLPAPGVAR